jgi:glycosyltransferase involved in cell wall biosynthesis
MKLLIFAHIPPPHHGQSYMVQLMLNGFGGDRRKPGVPTPSPYGLECYHVNAQVSKELEDIGDFRLGKLFLLIGYCLQAIWCHFRYGVDAMYYIPAPGKRSALYRDWLVMLFCRPFYKKIILHWHAAGLAKWLETHVQMRSRVITYKRLRDVDLSIVLSRYNRADAEKLLPKQIRVVSNGIPDPCPQFAEDVLPRHRARFRARNKLSAGQTLTPTEIVEADGDPHIFKVLYLAHCTREKGLFDSIRGVISANKKLVAANSPMTIQLQVAGNFVTDQEREEFDRFVASPDGKCINPLGFVGGEQKQKALRKADFFCFPTFYQNENQPVNLIEAMAFGLPILTTRWRSIPELFPPDYRCLVDICSPEQIAEVLVASLTGETAESFREIFLSHFNLEQHLAALAEAIQSVELPPGSGQFAANPWPVTQPNPMPALSR